MLRRDCATMCRFFNKIRSLCFSNSLSASNRCSSCSKYFTYSQDFFKISTLGARSLSMSSGRQSLRRWNFSFNSSRLLLSKTLWVARVVSLSSESSAASSARIVSEVPRVKTRRIFRPRFGGLSGIAWRLLRSKGPAMLTRSFEKLGSKVKRWI